jgi:hypothetical protein
VPDPTTEFGVVTEPNRVELFDTLTGFRVRFTRATAPPDEHPVEHVGVELLGKNGGRKGTVNTNAADIARLGAALLALVRDVAPSVLPVATLAAEPGYRDRRDIMRESGLVSPGDLAVVPSVKVCISCGAEMGQPHRETCVVYTGRLASAPPGQAADERLVIVDVDDRPHLPRPPAPRPGEGW